MSVKVDVGNWTESPWWDAHVASLKQMTDHFGFLFIIGNHFTIDLFGEYSYKRLHFHSKKHGTHGHTV
jgi:hypothetical protein